jgi:hypothetical protein
MKEMPMADELQNGPPCPTCGRPTHTVRMHECRWCCVDVAFVPAAERDDEPCPECGRPTCLLLVHVCVTCILEKEQ